MPALDVPPARAAASVDRTRHYFLGAPFDDIAQDAAVDLVEGSQGQSKFRYVVTPNVDHVVRLNGDRLLAPYYDEAWMSLCDSKPISTLSHAVSLDLPVVTGSGGLTKFNLTRLELPKSHWLDVACAGQIESLEVLIE